MSLSATKLSPNEIVRFAQVILPEASSLSSDGLVVVLLGGLFLLMIAEDTERVNAGSIMTQIHSDVGHYTSIFAHTGVLTALANLVLLEVLGVDFARVWCVLYYFLNFIPGIGFILALVPPSCVALLMLGWRKALLVAGGLVLTQLVSSYAITPMLLRKKGVKVSSFVEPVARPVFIRQRA